MLRVRLVDGVLRVGAYGERAARIVRLKVWREEANERDNIRTSRIVRGTSKREPEELGVDRQQRLESGLKRNCLTCEEHQCDARDALVSAL